MTAKRTAAQIRAEVAEAEFADRLAAMSAAYTLPSDFPSLQGQGMISIDTEGHDPDLAAGGSGVWSGRYRLGGVSVGTEAGFRQYYPVGHDVGPNLPKDVVVRWLKRELATDTPKVGANLLYDLQILQAEGIEVGGPLYDVQIAEPLITEDRFSYGLGPIARDYLGVGKKTDELSEYLIRKFGKKNHMAHIAKAPSYLVAPYAISDVDLPLKIFAKQKQILEDQGLWGLFILESKLIPMLAAMRRRGVQVNVEATERMLTKVREEYLALQAKIKHQTGVQVEPWEVNSFVRVFDDAGIPYPLTPKTQKPSFTAGFLEACEHPVAQDIVEMRKLDKLAGTFLEGSILNRQVNGVIHCNFNQLKGEGGGAVSGRFSSSAPNLQFIPVRTEMGRAIRRLFEAGEGKKWWAKDYSQIEYRLMVHDAAWMSFPGADAVVQEYLTNPDADFHSKVAEMVFGNASKESRTSAKTINFGLAYGEGKDKLASQLGLGLQQALALIETYHARAPFMRRLALHFTSQANRTGEVLTLLGRKRRFTAWEIWDRKEKKSAIVRHRMPGARRAFTHKAMNARTQGSAADVMKKAMVDSWESGVYDVLGPPALTVHDELDGDFEPTRASFEALGELDRIMEQTVELLVPLKVDGSTGLNWGDAK